MFSNKSEEAGASSIPSIVSAGLKISGNLETGGDIQIDGTVEGNIIADRVTLGAEARITGDIDAEEVIIQGSIVGNICAVVVSLASSSVVKGDIVHTELSVEKGANIDGRCSHSDSPRAASEPVAIFQNPNQQS
jgi:cytoskeletal protein CcmA (bactofilin family)